MKKETKHSKEIAALKGRINGLTDELSRSKKEILKAQKLESIGILTGNIAHDLNNILTVIQGNISLARIHTDQNGLAFKKLTQADTSIEGARDLTQQLLTFSKRGTPVHIHLSAGRDNIALERKRNHKVLTGNGKIIIMDDDEFIGEICSDMVTQLGYEPLYTRDGSEALEVYKKELNSSQKIVAIIIDLTIPGGMGGRDCIKELLKIDPDVKAIVSSGYSNDPIMAEYQKYGFTGVIAKPYSIDDLSAVLRKVTK